MNTKVLLFAFCFTCWIVATPVLAKHSSNKDFSKNLLQSENLLKNSIHQHNELSSFSSSQNSNVLNYMKGEESDMTRNFLQKYPRKANKQTFLGPYNTVLLSTSEDAETSTDKSATKNENTGLTSSQMDEIITQLKTSLDGVSQDVKNSLEMATENATAHMAQQVQELSKDVQRSIGKIETSLEKEGNKTREEVTLGSEKINKEILRTQRKIDANTIETRAIRITMLEQELEDKEEELKELEERINQLKAKLPPPTSICNQYLDCGTCTVNPRCGWCTAEQKCVEGDKVGPLYETCNFYDYGVCSGSTCGRYKDCSSCIQDPFCGWCAEKDHQSGLCLERSADYEGCPMNDWFHSAAVKNRCDLPQPTSANPLNTSIIESVEGKNALEKERKEREDKLKLQAATNEQHKQILQMQDELIKDQQKAEILRNQIATLKGTISRLKVSQTEAEKQVTVAEKEYEEEEKLEQTEEKGGEQEVEKVETVTGENVNANATNVTEEGTVTKVEASVDNNAKSNENEAVEETVTQVEATIEENMSSEDELSESKQDTVQTAVTEEE